MAIAKCLGHADAYVELLFIKGNVTLVVYIALL